MKNNWSYLSGFFDGEGCISVQRILNRKKTAYYYTVRLSTANTNKDVIEYLQKMWGTRLRTYIRKTKTYGNNRSPCYHLEVDKKEFVKKFLKGIYPFSIVKKKQIELSLELMDDLSKRSFCGFRSVPTEVTNYRDGIYKEIKKDKHKWLAVKEVLEK